MASFVLFLVKTFLLHHSCLYRTTDIVHFLPALAHPHQTLFRSSHLPPDDKTRTWALFYGICVIIHTISKLNSVYDNNDTDTTINAVFMISGVVMVFQYRICSVAQSWSSHRARGSTPPLQGCRTRPPTCADDYQPPTRVPHVRWVQGTESHTQPCQSHSPRFHPVVAPTRTGLVHQDSFSSIGSTVSRSSSTSTTSSVCPMASDSLGLLNRNAIALRYESCS